MTSAEKQIAVCVKHNNWSASASVRFENDEYYKNLF